MKHYHVLVGLRGMYMPNSNEVFRTRRQAESYAFDLVESFRSDGETTVCGSARDGYYFVGYHECIEITECTEPECLEDLDE